MDNYEAQGMKIEPSSFLFGGCLLSLCSGWGKVSYQEGGWYRYQSLSAVRLVAKCGKVDAVS
jgi:hypothetical protein